MAVHNKISVSRAEKAPESTTIRSTSITALSPPQNSKLVKGEFEKFFSDNGAPSAIHTNYEESIR